MRSVLETWRDTEVEQWTQPPDHQTHFQLWFQTKPRKKNLPPAIQSEKSPKDTQMAAQPPSTASTTPPETGISDHDRLGRLTQITSYSFYVEEPRNNSSDTTTGRGRASSTRSDFAVHHQPKIKMPRSGGEIIADWQSVIECYSLGHCLWFVYMASMATATGMMFASILDRLHVCILFSLSTPLSPCETSVCKASQTGC